MKNVAFKVMGRWLLGVYGEHDPTPEDGVECLRILRGLDLARIRILIYSKGGVPTPTQRKEMNELVKGLDIPVAVLSGSRIARGVVTALSWFNHNMKPFAPDDELDAFEYLEIPVELHDSVSQELHRLVEEVGQRKTSTGKGPQSKSA